MSEKPNIQKGGISTQLNRILNSVCGALQSTKLFQKTSVHEIKTRANKSYEATEAWLRYVYFAQEFAPNFELEYTSKHKNIVVTNIPKIYQDNLTDFGRLLMKLYYLGFDSDEFQEAVVTPEERMLIAVFTEYFEFRGSKIRLSVKGITVATTLDRALAYLREITDPVELSANLKTIQETLLREVPAEVAVWRVVKPVECYQNGEAILLF